MRKIKRRKGKNKVIIITSLCLLLVLTVGYAAFQTNLTLKAKGKIIVLQDLYVASYGSDAKGNGTREKPYATIQKAYNMAGDTGSIHILDNITQKETIDFDKDKEITLDSVNNNSIIRDSSLTSTLLNINDGTTTFQNITFDGDNVKGKSTLIIASSDININSGAVFTNIYSDGSSGNGNTIRMYVSGTLTLNGGEFFNNTYPNGGGSAIYMQGQNTVLIINDTNIHDNYSKDGAIWSSGQITFNNGKIYNNTSTAGAGGIFNNGIMNMYGGEIYNNKAQYGAGIACGNPKEVSYTTLEYAELTINGGKIYNNVASGTAGGSYGGGIYFRKDSKYNYIGGTIENNKPDNIFRNSYS